MKENILVSLLVLLILLSSVSVLFDGRSIPKQVWWLSFISSGLAGFVAGILMAPFPENLLIGSFVSLGSIILFFVSGAIRRKPR
jgi:hypothetical protein